MSYLSGFIRNLPDLKLSMWQGNVVLTNLQIREGAFSDMLPFQVVGGYIQELRITIPWSSLTSSPVQVWLKRVDINVAFGNGPKTTTVKPFVDGNPFESGSEDEDDDAAAEEAANNNSGGGWTGSIATKIANNVEIKAEGVTVRIFDTESEDSATLSIGSAHFYSCDGAFTARQFVDPANVEYMRKVCRVEDVSLSIASGFSESLAKDVIFSGAAATLRLEKVGNLRGVRLNPPDSPTTRIDVRMTEVSTKFEPDQLAFLLRALNGMIGGPSPDDIDAVEIELRKTPPPVGPSLSPAPIPKARDGPLVSIPSALPPVATAPPPQQSQNKQQQQGWMGWLLGSDGAAQNQQGKDLLQFSEPVSPVPTSSKASSSSASVSSVAFGFFVQHLSATLLSHGMPNIVVQSVGVAIEVSNGELVCAGDSVSVHFGDHPVLSLRASYPIETPPPVEKWAFELFASQSGGGNKSVGMDATVRLFRPDSLFDPNGFRVASAVGLADSVQNQAAAENDEDASYIVGEFGIMEHTPKKTGRFKNEKPAFRGSSRQPDWQRGCGVTSLAWHSFQAFLLRLGPSLNSAGADFLKRPIHQELGLRLDYVHASLVPGFVTALEKLGAALQQPAATKLVDPNSVMETPIDPFNPSFEVVLDQFLSRVWRTPPTSIDIRVSNLVAILESDVMGFPSASVRVHNLVVSDNYKDKYYVGIDFIRRCRTHRPHALEHSPLEKLRDYACSCWTIVADQPTVNMGDTAIVASKGTVELVVSLSRNSALWDYLGVVLDLKGAFSCAFSPSHLSFFAHWLNIFTGSSPSNPPLIPLPSTLLRVQASDFHLGMSPSFNAIGVNLVSVTRDSFGPIISPSLGARMTKFSFNMGSPCPSFASTMSKGFWTAPTLEVLLHSASVRIDYEAIFGWLLAGLSIIDNKPAPLELLQVVTAAPPPPLQRESFISLDLYQMLSWPWSLSLKDVEILLKKDLILMIPSVEVRRTAQGHGNSMAIRNVTLGGLFGRSGLAVGALVECKDLERPSVNISVDSDTPMNLAVSTQEIESILVLLDDVAAHFDGRKSYPHCWGPPVLASSSTAEEPVVPVATTPNVWVDTEINVKVPVVEARVKLGDFSEIVAKVGQCSIKLGRGLHSEEFLVDVAAMSLSCLTDERQQLYCSCARFLVHDSTFLGDRSFKLEVFALVADRLDNVAKGVPETADTIIRSLDITAVKKDGSVIASSSPCFIHVDARTVASIFSLLGSVSKIKTPSGPKKVVVSAPLLRTSSAGIPVANSPAIQPFSFKTESVTVQMTAPGKVQSLIVLSGISLLHNPRQSNALIESVSWKNLQSSNVVYVVSGPGPLLKASAVVGRDAMVEISPIRARIPTDLIETVVSIFRGPRRDEIHAPTVSSAHIKTVSLPSPFPSFLVPYKRCKILVGALNFSLEDRLVANSVSLSVKQVFLSTDLIENSEQHVGSLTVVDVEVKTSHSRVNIVEPTTLMAELLISPIFVEVSASVTHPVRVHLRPGDLATLEKISSEALPARVSLPSARGVLPRDDVVEVAPVVSGIAFDEATLFTRVDDVISKVALVGNADGRRPEVGECVLGLEQHADGGLSSFAAWKLSHPHALTTVMQRHVVPLPDRSYVAVVHVQYWDRHLLKYSTAGSLLLSENLESSRCVFPLHLSSVRETEWRLLCQIRSTSGSAVVTGANVSPQLLISAVGANVAWIPGEVCVSLNVPKSLIYLSHAYKREADNVNEEEEVLLLQSKNLRMTHTSGDGRSSCAAVMALKCVLFDELSLVDIVEPFHTTAIFCRSAWDVRLSRTSINVSPFLLGTISRFAALWTRTKDVAHSSEFEFAHFVLFNRCCTALVCGQEGTSESITLPARCRTKYSWQSGLKAPHVLQVWLTHVPSEKLRLSLDDCLPSNKQSVELRVQLADYVMFMKVERVSAAASHNSRLVSFLGTYLIHSELHSAVTINFEKHMAPDAPKEQFQVVLKPGESVGLVEPTQALPRTVANVSLGRIKYGQSLVLQAPEGEETQRHLLEAAGTDLHFWACQVGTRLSLIPLLTLRNESPCALSFRCGATTKTLEPGHVASVENLNLQRSFLACRVGDSAWSKDFAITMELLRMVREKPELVELVCGHHTLYLSLFTEPQYGGVSGVLFSRFHVRNDTLMNVSVLPGQLPVLPEEREAAAKALTPVTVVAKSLLMLPWEASSEELSVRPASSVSIDDWHSFKRDPLLQNAGLPLTLKNGDLRFPYLALFKLKTSQDVSSHPPRVSSSVVLASQMFLHSKLDIPMLVRIGCEDKEHGRCLSGSSFRLDAHEKRELTGFGFGFHISVSFDGGKHWSEQILVGKDKTRTPVTLLRSGPEMLLCYSVVVAPDGSLHTTIMRDTTPPLCVRNGCRFDLHVATLTKTDVMISVSAGACVSVPPEQDSGTKLVVAKDGFRALPLLVESDGDGSVKVHDTMLHFRITSVMGSRLVHFAEVPFPRIQMSDQAPSKTRVAIGVEELSLSLFDDRVDAECVRLVLRSILLDYSQRVNPNMYSLVKVLTDLSVTIASLQLDNHTLEAGEFPVVVVSSALVERRGGLVASKAMFHMRTTFGTCAEGLHVDECTLSLQPISLFVSEAFVLFAQHELDLFLEAMSPLMATKELSIDAMIEKETVTPPFIRFLKVSALQFRVTLHFNLERVHLHLGMDNSPVGVSEVVMNDLSIRAEDLMRNLVSLYLADIVVRTPTLLGSLQILGNPTSFVGSVIDGVYDLLAMPMKGVRDMNPVNTVLGLGRGSVSFARHLSVGTLRSFSGWFGSLAKNMDMLTMDEAYILKHIRERSVASRSGVGESLLSGMRGLGSAFVEGLVGVVEQPYRGAQEGGVRGLLVGSAMGAVNAVLKPIGGAMELVSRAAQGALVSAGGGPFSDQCKPQRKCRTIILSSDIKWRRKVASVVADGTFFRAFDCKRVDESKDCVVLLTTTAVLIVENDVIVDRLNLVPNQPFLYQELFTSAHEPVFHVGNWKLTLTRGDRREFSVFFRQHLMMTK